MSFCRALTAFRLPKMSKNMARVRGVEPLIIQDLRAMFLQSPVLQGEGPFSLHVGSALRQHQVCMASRDATHLGKTKYRGPSP